ncbi:MAG: PEP-CTERM sorting domain-containing protein [Burkholderiales bacterium]|nr:PEP-CTERM sorting domain-containing protein [Burkholderiales bacterium]
MSFGSHLRRRAAASLGCLLLAAPAAAMTLAPALPGSFAAGRGVDAVFLDVDDAWHQSTVLWNESTGRYGSGAAIGSMPWGSGLWGLADWRTANLAPTPGMVVGRWEGRVPTIGFGDATYTALHAPRWGAVAPLPLAGTGGAQDNWTAHFHGYIRIAEAGAYNFGVLHDDGFFFRLVGAGGQAAALAHDFLNPREVLGFDADLQLAPGLYGFELGAYDRLEAGVVDLAWARNGGAWQRVPRDSLVAAADALLVPEPGTVVLWLAGALALAALTRALRRALRPPPAARPDR